MLQAEGPMASTWRLPATQRLGFAACVALAAGLHGVLQSVADMFAGEAAAKGLGLRLVLAAPDAEVADGRRNSKRKTRKAAMTRSAIIKMFAMPSPRPKCESKAAIPRPAANPAIGPSQLRFGAVAEVGDAGVAGVACLAGAG